MDHHLYQIGVLLFLINLSVAGYYYYIYQDQKNNLDEEVENYKTGQLDDAKYAADCLANENTGNPQETSISHGFHDKFAKHTNQALGWRHYYLQNQSHYMVEKDTNFSGTSVRPFLDNQENVNNYVVPKKDQRKTIESGNKGIVFAE